MPLKRLKTKRSTAQVITKRGQNNLVKLVLVVTIVLLAGLWVADKMMTPKVASKPLNKALPVDSSVNLNNSN